MSSICRCLRVSWSARRPMSKNSLGLEHACCALVDQLTDMSPIYQHSPSTRMQDEKLPIMEFISEVDLDGDLATWHSRMLVKVVATSLVLFDLEKKRRGKRGIKFSWRTREVILGRWGRVGQLLVQPYRLHNAAHEPTAMSSPSTNRSVATDHARIEHHHHHHQHHQQTTNTTTASVATVSPCRQTSTPQ